MGHNDIARRVSRPVGKPFLETMEVGVAARGVLFVHSCPPALRPHVEWAVAGVFGVPVQLDWQPQPVAPGCLRAQTGWRGAAGTAGRLAAPRGGWPLVRGGGTRGAAGRRDAGLAADPVRGDRGAE